MIQFVHGLYHHAVSYIHADPQFSVHCPVTPELNCAISGTHLRSAVEYGVSTHIWSNFYTSSTDMQ